MINDGRDISVVRAENRVHSKTEVITIAVGELLIDEEFNYRGSIKLTEVRALAEGIKRQGLLQPIVVVKIKESSQPYIAGYRYKLVAGFRRTMAVTRILEWLEIPATVVDAKDHVDELCINILENEDRQDVPFAQSALAVSRLMADGLSEAQIQRKLNKTRGWTQVRVQFMELPVEIRDDINDHNTTAKYPPVTQQSIRDLRTLLLNKGEEVCFEGFRQLKTALQTGHKKVNIKDVGTPKAVKQASLKLKHSRCQRDVENMIMKIFECMSDEVDNPMTKVLAWSLGNASDEEVYEVCGTWCKEHEILFNPNKAIDG